LLRDVAGGKERRGRGALKVGKHHQHNAKMPLGCKAVNLSRGK